MNYGLADFKAGQREAASGCKHLDWLPHILWLMDQHHQATYRAIKNFWALRFFESPQFSSMCVLTLQVGTIWPPALCTTATAAALPTPKPTAQTGFLLRWQDIVLPSMAVGVKDFTWNIRGARLRAERSGSPDATRLLQFSRRTSAIPSANSPCRNCQVIYLVRKFLPTKKKIKKNGRPVAESRPGTQIGLEKQSVKKEKLTLSSRGPRGVSAYRRRHRRRSEEEWRQSRGPGRQ